MTDGSNRIPTTPRSTTTRADSTVHPSSSSNVSAAGTRLRRRLSKIFHCDSSESGLRSPAPVETGHAPPQPSHKLPVAADPATTAGHVGAVARGILLVQFHVAQQPGTRVTPFQKIVAQDAILGKAPLECTLERVDVVDPLADERAFVEDVLIDVRDRARVRVDARLATVQPRVPRPVRAGQAHDTRGWRIP